MTVKIERLQEEVATAAKAHGRAESKLQRELETLGEGAQVRLLGVPYEVAYWRNKWRLKCLVSKANRERLQKVARKR